MSKPKILCAVLTGIERTNWINPDLSLALITMARDPRFDFNYYPVRDCRPFETARNMTIKAAKQIAADWLISFDNDNYPMCNPLDVIAEAGPEQRGVIGLTYAIGNLEQGYRMYPDAAHGAVRGSFREEDSVAGGCLMIHRTIWEQIKAPWFKWQHAPDSETLAPENGRTCGEDVYFCRLAREHGFKIWTHRNIAAHYRTTNLTAISCTLAQLSQQAQAAQHAPAPQASRWVTPPHQPR